MAGQPARASQFHFTLLSISAGASTSALGKKMKIRIDISDEFADLATTWYQRYVLYRLESTSSTKPWKPFVGWIVIMVLGSLFRLPFDEMWWYYLVMTMIFTATISEIYIFRVVLAMMRECRHKYGTIGFRVGKSI